MAEYSGTGTGTWTWSTTTGTTTASTQVWQSWTAAVTATGTAATTTATAFNQVYEVWRQWQRLDGLTAREYQERDARILQERADRADRMQEIREQNARRTLAAAQDRERLKEAHKRGLRLLRELLTPEQRDQMDRDEIITVRGSAGGLYKVQLHTKSVHGNITSIDEHGCFLGRLCVAPRMQDHEGNTLPLSDGWVGQLLAIRHDEEELLAKANWSFVHPCAQLQQAA